MNDYARMTARVSGHQPMLMYLVEGEVELRVRGVAINMEKGDCVIIPQEVSFQNVSLKIIKHIK